MIIENGFTSCCQSPAGVTGQAKGQMFGEVKHKALALAAWFQPGVQALS